VEIRTSTLAERAKSKGRAIKAAAPIEQPDAEKVPQPHQSPPKKPCLGCTIKANPGILESIGLHEPSMWNKDPSKFSEMAVKLKRKMGNRHLETKCYHPGEHFECVSDKTCKNSFVIELG
jgi:hypothetical protein